jgi:hypothetical protein
MEPKGPLEPSDVPELVELPAHRVEDTHGAETESFVKRYGSGIRQAHACNHPVNVLALEHSKQRAIERRAAAPAKGLWVTVNAGLDGRVVRRLGSPEAATRVPQAPVAGVSRNQQAVWTGITMIIEPSSALRRCKRPQIRM